MWASNNRIGDYWQIDTHPNNKKRKILGFAVENRPHDDSKKKSQFVKTWKIEVLNDEGKWVQVNRERCPNDESQTFFEAHQTNSDIGKQYHILFPTTQVTSSVRFYPQTYQNHMSAKLALLVETQRPPVTDKLPQFGAKFKGHLQIESVGEYTFRVETSHPFQLVVNNEGIISQLQAGVETGSIAFAGPGSFPIEAQYFYYGELDNGLGNNYPSLQILIKFEDGAFRSLSESELNVVGKATTPPCPQHLSSMRLEMRSQMTSTNTGSSSSSSSSAQLNYACSIQELILPTILQWSTSYNIFVMAHDNMPLSFESTTGFGDERACGRKFCYVTIAEGPQIQLQMSAVDNQGLLGRRKNQGWKVQATFPSKVLLEGSNYEFSFNLNSLGIQTTGTADTSTIISFTSPKWDAAPGIADVSVTGAFPEFQGCVDANLEFRQQQSSANMRLLMHERYTIRGSKLRGSTPFKECWSTCSKNLDNVTEYGDNYGLNPTTRSSSKYRDRPTAPLLIDSAYTYDGSPQPEKTLQEAAFDLKPDTSFSIEEKDHQAGFGPPSLEVFFQPTDLAWIKITNCNEQKLKNFKMEYIADEKNGSTSTFQSCGEVLHRHGRFGTFNFKCPRSDERKVSGLRITPIKANHYTTSGGGGWGGECACPNGQKYWVGDAGDACGSLACVGGTSGSCNKWVDNKWNGKKVVCDTSSSSNLYTTFGGGGWGGECTCPDGQKYWVGDAYDSCGSLACVGGTSGSCNSRVDNKWNGKKVVCAPPPTIPQFSLCEVEVVGYEDEAVIPDDESSLGSRCNNECGWKPGTRQDGFCDKNTQCPPGECCGNHKEGDAGKVAGCSRIWCKHKQQNLDVKEVVKEWCKTSDDNTAFTSGLSNSVCDNDKFGSKLYEDSLETTLSIGIKKNGGLTTRTPLWKIEFYNGEATATPAEMYGEKLTIKNQWRGDTHVGPNKREARAYKVWNRWDQHVNKGDVGFHIFHGEKKGFPLAKEYTISIWVRGSPNINQDLFKSPWTWNALLHKWEPGLHMLQIGEDRRIIQYYPLGTPWDQATKVLNSDVSIDDVFNSDPNEWSRLTLVAVGGKTWIYKDAVRKGSLPIVAFARIFNLGSGGKVGAWDAPIADMEYWDVPLEYFEILELNGMHDRSLGICACSLSSLNVAKARYSDKTKCDAVNKRSNVLEMYTASVQTLQVKEQFEFVWPYPHRLKNIFLNNPVRGGARSMDVSWAATNNFNGVPVFGTYVVIDYALVQENGQCPDVNDVATCDEANWKTCPGWKRHKMKEGSLPCLPPAIPVRIGGELDEHTNVADSTTLLIPNTEYCFRTCCSATPFDGSSMSTRPDEQQHTWSNRPNAQSSCPSNEWTVAKKRTKLPDPPSKIKNDAIKITDRNDESLTVEWELLTEDTTVTGYVIVWVPQHEQTCPPIVYDLRQNYTVGRSHSKKQIKGLQPKTSYYVGVAAKNVGGIHKMIGRTTGTTKSVNTNLLVGHPDTQKLSTSQQRRSFPSISAALGNTTVDDQVITVFEGIYSLQDKGPMTFRNHRITIHGHEGKEKTTIVDCHGHRCFEPRYKCLKSNEEITKLNGGLQPSDKPPWDTPWWGSWPFASRIAYLTLTNGSSPLGETGGIVLMQMSYQQSNWELINYKTYFHRVIFHSGQAHHGGCLSVDNRDVILTECELTDCHSKASGGAILLTGKAKMQIRKTTFSNNTAGMKIKQDGRGTTMSCVQSGASLDPIGGGAISVVNKITSFACPKQNTDSTNPDLLIVGSKFTQSTTECGSGGTIFFRQSLVVIKRSLMQFSSARSGGAIYGSKSTAKFWQVQVSKSTATHSNGGAAAILGTSITLEGCRFTSNFAEAEGGALFLIFSDLNIMNTHIINNHAASGGGLSLGFSCSLASKENTYKNNIAKNNGGALALSSTKQFESLRDRFENNVGGANGGCIYIYEPMVNDLSITSGKLISCTADKLGGGVYFESVSNKDEISNIQLRATSITATKNRAKSAGGVVYWTKNLRRMNYDALMIPAVLISFTTKSGNSAHVGNIMASGPCKLIHWTGPVHGIFVKIDRTRIATNFGQIVDREDARRATPSLFPTEIVAGAPTDVDVAILDYYGQHLNFHGGSSLKLNVFEVEQIVLEPIWHFGNLLPATPSVAGKSTGIQVEGFVRFRGFKLNGRPGGIYKVSVRSSAMSVKNCRIELLCNKLYFQIKLRYCTYGERVNTMSTPYCQPCTKGKFSNISGPTVPMQCTACPEGQFQPLTGQTSCNQCEVGKFNAVSQSSLPCRSCLQSTFQNKTGQQSCDNCFKGRFRDQRQPKLLDGTPNDGSICDICPLGKETTSREQKECSLCPIGKYGAFEGDIIDVDGKKRDITRCSLCPAGRYSTKLGATTIETCQPCRSGTYMSEEGRGKCVKCDTRMWTIGQTGKSSCELCPVGRFSIPDGHRCQSCKIGEYQNRTGQMTCETCLDGKWTIGQTNFDICTPCTATQIFMPETRTCEECMSLLPQYADTFALLPGETQKSCRKCPRGGICHGDHVIKAKPGWWLSNGLDVERANCEPNPRQPPRRCGDGAQKCAEEDDRGSYFDECDATRFLLKCAVQRSKDDERPQVCNPYTELLALQHWEQSVGSSNATVGGGNTTVNFNGTGGTKYNHTTILHVNIEYPQCLCIEGKECYEGKMCEKCRQGYVRTGDKECKFCDVYPIPPIQMAGFVMLLLLLLCLFVKVTVKSAGSSSPAGSMKKIVINFLQLESLAMGFPLQWPPLVNNMFSSMGVTSSASSDVFVIECVFPSNYFNALPPVYVKTIIVAVMPILFMLWCGIAWYFMDHLCQKKISPLHHTTVPAALYLKHNLHNKEKVERLKLENQLKEFCEHDSVPDELQAGKVSKVSTDNSSVEDFGYVFRQALETALRHKIDVEASFEYFINLNTAEETSKNEKKQEEQQSETTTTTSTPAEIREMSTAAFEHMLIEWKSPITNDALLWSMLERVDMDGSGWISLSELRAFERSTLDRAILSATVVAYMFYPTCCKAAFMLISCRSDLFDGADILYMNDDMEEACWKSLHLASVLMIGIPILVIWVIGMPLFIFVVLESHRRSKHNDKIRFRYGMLMEGYEDDYFYWESVIASRKMMIIGVSVFMSNYTVDIQAYVGIAIVILFMTMHISSNPYNSSGKFYRCQYFLLVLLMVVGLSSLRLFIFLEWEVLGSRVVLGCISRGRFHS